MIKLAVFDVDGTLTDGGIYLDGGQGEWKRFHVQDGMGIALLSKGGVVPGILSGRFSPVTERRARELGIMHCVNGVEEKLPELRKLAEDLGISRNEVAFVGDDINDMECIAWAGLGVAVQNARKEVKAEADWITPSFGGCGAVRDVAEYILERNAAERRG